MIDSNNVVTTARNLFEAQAAELANYKQLATTAIDDAVALRAQLAALQCEDELPELPEAVAWMSPGKERLEFSRQDTVYGSHTIPLYARQAQAMVRAKMVPLTDEVAEAMRKQFVKLPRYSFLLDDGGNVRRVQIKTGNWVEFTKAHELFDPVNVDAAIARKPLTDDQIYELYSEPSSDAEMVAFARAIESAHGITGESK